MNKFVKCLDSTWFLVLALDLCLNSLQIKQKWFPNWSFPIYWSRSSGREILPEIIGNESNTYLHQLTYYFFKLYYTMYIINFFFVIKILMRFHAILAFIILLAVFTCENGSIGEMLVHVMSLEIGQMFDSFSTHKTLMSILCLTNREHALKEKKLKLLTVNVYFQKKLLVLHQISMLICNVPLQTEFIFTKSSTMGTI